MDGSQENALAPKAKSDSKPDVRQELVDLDWQQGSVLSQEIVDELVKRGVLAKPQAAAIFVIVSHDCDVIHASLEAEPTVECLEAVPVAGPTNGSLRHGKSRRRLQFDIGDKVFEATILPRYFFPRDVLRTGRPAAALKITAREKKLLGNWISKRYFREAFPNAFEDRLRIGNAHEKIRKELKTRGDNVTGIYLLMPGGELPKEEAYEISIKATMDVDSHGNAARRTEAQELVQAIAKHMRACPGIEVFEAEAVSLGSITLDDLNFLKRWDCDDLSLRDDGDFEPQR